MKHFKDFPCEKCDYGSYELEKTFNMYTIDK